MNIHTQLIQVLILVAGMIIILTSARLISGKSGRDWIFKLTRNLMFIIFTGALIYLTFIYGGRGNHGNVELTFRLSFWRAIKNSYYGALVHASLMNLLLFVPLGYLLPQFKEIRFTRELRWWQNLIIAFAVSLAIETLQLVLHRGTFQLDDLIRNTEGGVIGFALARLTGCRRG